MPDGRLGLIDYGQVKRMRLEERISYAKLIIAMCEDDKEEIARIQFEDFGVVTKYQNPEIAYKLTVFWNDRSV